MWDVLLGLKSKGKVVFLTTHHMEEAELLADTVAIVSKGKLVATGSPDQLIERHTDDMCLTLKSVDARALETIRHMSFTPVRDNRNNIKVRVKLPDDVQQILGLLGIEFLEGTVRQMPL